MRRSTVALVVLAAVSPLLFTLHHHLALPHDKLARDAHTWFGFLTNSYRFSLTRASSDRAATSTTTATCGDDPYALPGYLQVNRDPTSLHENRWITLVKGCEAPRLLDAFKKGAEDVRWAQNRTVVVFGDSVARENIVYFCEMVGAELHRVTWSHDFSPSPRPSQLAPPLHPSSFIFASDYGKGPSPFPPPWDPDADPALSELWKPKQEPGNGEQSHMPHFCYVKEMGFLLLQQFQYGMDQEDYWAFKPGYIPPGTFEDRLHTLLVPLVEKAITTLHYRQKQPELIMLNSALWDTARWTREDMRFGRDTDSGLTVARLNWYKTRIRQAVLAIADVYPKSSISWVTNHYPTANGPSDWFTSGIKAHAADKAGNQDDNRGLACDSFDSTRGQADDDDDIGKATGAERGGCSSDLTACRRQILRDVRVNEWGKLMLGQEKHMKDALHQALVPGGRLWADMMLFDLRRAVQQQEAERR